MPAPAAPKLTNLRDSARNSIRPVKWSAAKIRAVNALILVSALVFIGTVVWQLLVEGPFAWHVQQPAFWQGGIEAVLVLMALATAQWLPRRSWRVLASVLIAEIFLRRHAVDAALFVDLLYLELIIALGAFITRLCGAPLPADIPAYLRAFVLGFCAWSVCAWTLSAFGLGSVRDLRWLSALLILPAMASRTAPWSLFAARRIDAMPAPARAAAVALIGWLLILFARSATALGFDGQWYGLRGEHVLVGEGSAFISQGLVAPVYYFPKVYELFLIPLSGLGSSSVIVGMTILTLGLFGAAGYELLRQLGVRGALPRILGVALFLSLPAVANIAMEAKPDLLAAFLLSLAWLSAAQFIATRSVPALIWLIGLLVFSTQAKLTAIPFAAGLFLATAAAFFVTRRGSYSGRSAAGSVRLASMALTLLLIVTAFATARTLLLTGMPTIGPDPLFKLWQALGFNLKFPVGTLQWGARKDWADTPALLLDLLFRPQNLYIVIITWTGNVWLWLGTIALCAHWLRRRGGRLRELAPTSSFATESPPPPRLRDRSQVKSAMFWSGASLVLMAFIVMFGWGFNYRGGDGNYFIAGLVPAILLTFAAAVRGLPSTLHRSFFVAALGFCALGASYSFVSGWWIDGTRGFDSDFHRSARTFRHESRAKFRETGILQIAEHLRKLHRDARVIGCTEFGGALGFHLPARFEDIASIAFSRPEFPSSKELFGNFLKADHIEYLLLACDAVTTANCPGGKVLAEIAADLANDATIPTLNDERYVLYDIRNWQPK